ncbi:MAG: DUF84 family protein [Acidobacteria bacterium]|nr:MAG: DUF84 family protein [Acidobacteriota bacterium]REK10368.1 MAG: DUF84 family protein [Acidobacteriota bacterium]
MSLRSDLLTAFWNRFPEDRVRVAVVGEDPDKRAGVLLGMRAYLGFDPSWEKAPPTRARPAERRHRGPIAGIREVEEEPAPDARRELTVTSVPDGGGEGAVPVDDAETVARALRRARALTASTRTPPLFDLYVCAEGGAHDLVVGDAGSGERFLLARSWVAIEAPWGRAIGSSASLQLPATLAAGGDGLPVPGTRRHGGVLASLTGGLLDRRHAVATATTHALASLVYPLLSSRPL